MSHFRFFLLRDLPGGEKSVDSSCGTHVRRIKSGRKLWRWQRRWDSLPGHPTGPHVAGNKGAKLLAEGSG